MEAQGDIYYANQDYTKADEIYHETLVNWRQQSIEMIEAQENYETLTILRKQQCSLVQNHSIG